MKTELKLGEIVGQRLWYYDKDNSNLLSLLTLSQWIPNKIFESKHIPSKYINALGINSFKLDQKLYFKMLWNVYNTGLQYLAVTNSANRLLGIRKKDLTNAMFLFYRNYPVVLGEVYLWGDVIEHEQGYRAQYAYPKIITRSYCCNWEIDKLYNDENIIVEINAKYNLGVSR